MINDEKGFGKKGDALDDLVDLGKRVSSILGEGDLVTTGFVLDNLPVQANKDALYAGLASRLALEYDKVGDHANDKVGDRVRVNADKRKELLGELMGYAKSKCSYFSRKP